MDFSKIVKIAENVLEAISKPEMSALVDDYVSIKPGQQTTQFTLGVPGYSKGDIRVAKAGDKLLIYVENKMVKSLFLTKSIDKEKIRSSVKDGVLIIDFSKAFEVDEEEINID